jgi:Sec-independent protein translocase protein TatA
MGGIGLGEILIILLVLFLMNSDLRKVMKNIASGIRTFKDEIQDKKTLTCGM